MPGEEKGKRNRESSKKLQRLGNFIEILTGVVKGSAKPHRIILRDRRLRCIMHSNILDLRSNRLAM